jgi:hypothetical protein
LASLLVTWMLRGLALSRTGGNLEGAFEFFATEVLPRARGN